jgi:hypothetical protein
MTREAFQTYFQNIFAVALPRDIQEIIEPAEKIRDKLMHGRGLEEPDLREAISRVLYYTDQINRFLEGRDVGFKPFVGDLRGFVGRLESLDTTTSKWILKGMGFHLS